MEPKVAIIVPVYNMERYLRECLDSLVGQTFRDIEIICFNDASTDSSIDILRDYATRDERFVIIDSSVNIKQGGGRNAGIRAARAPYIMFVDPDDWVEPDFVEKYYTKAVETRADIVVGDFNKITINSSGTVKIVNQNLCDKTETDTSIIKKLRLKCFVPIVSCLYNRQLFLSNNLYFPENIQLGEDTSIACALFIAASKIIKIDFALYNYRYRPNSSYHCRDKALFKYKFITALLARDNEHKADTNNKYYREIEENFIRYYFILPTLHALNNYGSPLYEEIDFAKSTISNYSDIHLINEVLSGLRMADKLTFKFLKHSPKLGYAFYRLRYIRGRLLEKLFKVNN